MPATRRLVSLASRPRDERGEAEPIFMLAVILVILVVLLQFEGVGFGFDVPWTAIGIGAGTLVLFGGIGAGATWTVRAGRRRRVSAADLEGRWTAAIAKHDVIMDEYATICADPLAALDNMALFDFRDSFTEAFTIAMGQCNDQRSVNGDRTPAHEAVVESFSAKVDFCAAKWHAAQVHARTHGLMVLPEADRGAAVQARKLLMLALDEKATRAERAQAARRASVLLDSLTDVALPEAMLLAIDGPARHQIEAGSGNGGDRAPITITSDPVLDTSYAIR